VFSESLVWQGFCRIVPKNPTHGFTVSTKSRPKLAKKQIFKFSQNGGQFAPTLDHYHQTLKAVTCKCQLSGVDHLRRHRAAILAKNVRRGGSSSQIGNRNMAATRFLDFSTPTSYSTPSTLGGLSRTVTDLPAEAVTITPLLRPWTTRKYSKSKMRFSNFERTFLEISEIDFFFKFSESKGLCRYFRLAKKSKIYRQSSEKK